MSFPVGHFDMRDYWLQESLSTGEKPTPCLRGGVFDGQPVSAVSHQGYLEFHVKHCPEPPRVREAILERLEKLQELWSRRNPGREKTKFTATFTEDHRFAFGTNRGRKASQHRGYLKWVLQNCRVEEDDVEWIEEILDR